MSSFGYAVSIHRHPIALSGLSVNHLPLSTNTTELHNPISIMNTKVQYTMIYYLCLTLIRPLSCLKKTK